jgi:hypothetical protein
VSGIFAPKRSSGTKMIEIDLRLRTQTLRDYVPPPAGGGIFEQAAIEPTAAHILTAGFLPLFLSKT